MLALLDRDSYAGDWVHLDSLARKDAARTRLQALHAKERERFLHEPALARTFGLSICSMPFDEAPDLWRRLGETKEANEY